MPVRYTDDELIAILRELGEELGGTPTVRSVRDRSDLPAPETFMTHFGGWTEAVEAAGFEPNPSWSVPQWQYYRSQSPSRSSTIEWAVDVSADGIDLGDTGLDMRAERITITVDGRTLVLDTDTWLDSEGFDCSYRVGGFVPAVRRHGVSGWLVVLVVPGTDDGDGTNQPLVWLADLTDRLSDGRVHIREGGE